MLLAQRSAHLTGRQEKRALCEARDRPGKYWRESARDSLGAARRELEEARLCVERSQALLAKSVCERDARKLNTNLGVESGARSAPRAFVKQQFYTHCQAAVNLSLSQRALRVAAARARGVAQAKRARGDQSGKAPRGALWGLMLLCVGEFGWVVSVSGGCGALQSQPGHDAHSCHRRGTQHPLATTTTHTPLYLLASVSLPHTPHLQTPPPPARACTCSGQCTARAASSSYKSFGLARAAPQSLSASIRASFLLHQGVFLRVVLFGGGGCRDLRGLGGWNALGRATLERCAAAKRQHTKRDVEARPAQHNPRRAHTHPTPPRSYRCCRRPPCRGLPASPPSSCAGRQRETCGVLFVVVGGVEPIDCGQQKCAETASKPQAAGGSRVDSREKERR